MPSEVLAMQRRQVRTQSRAGRNRNVDEEMDDDAEEMRGYTAFERDGMRQEETTYIQSMRYIFHFKIAS